MIRRGICRPGPEERNIPQDFNLPIAGKLLKSAVEALMEYGPEDYREVQVYFDRAYKGAWPLQEIPTTSLLFVQEWLVSDRLLNYGSVQFFPKDEPIMVAHWKGFNLIMDGNHRSAVALKKKKPLIHAAVLPVDKILGRYIERYLPG